MNHNSMIQTYIIRVIRNLRLLRRQREYSQEYMAFMLNISQNAYSRLESGKTPMTINRLFQICDLLEVHPVELLTLESIPDALSNSSR
ncbi:helix-turn-helix domain-containing protein [Chitinophaga sp.]|uniref:helix-turn-helix domain-containing protein n=1 Tax=Chitinophaga sp. TaxID=1869181 RepID=UPI0039C889B7